MATSDSDEVCYTLHTREAREILMFIQYDAAAQVFNTAELVEMILLELAMEDILLRAMRVCKYWKAVIDASLKLQQVLFFKAIPGPPGLLLEIDYTDSDSDYLPRISSTARRHTLFINPLLERQQRVLKRPGLRYRHPRNSYYQMLVSQPPVYSHGRMAGLIKNDEGLKLGIFKDRRGQSIASEADRLVGVYPKTPSKR